MNPAIQTLIAAARSAPMTHVVVTGYADGTVKRHETRNLGAAENWATGERRKIGKALLSRETGETGEAVEVVFAAVETL